MLKILYIYKVKSIIFFSKKFLIMGDALYVMKSLSYQQGKWVKLKRRMIKSKLKQGSNIYSILLWH